MGLGERLERVEFLQFFGGNFLEGRGNCPLLDIDFFPGELFKLLHSLCQQLEANRLPGREKRRPESGHSRKGDARRRVLVAGVAVALISDFDLVGPE